MFDNLDPSWADALKFIQGHANEEAGMESAMKNRVGGFAEVFQNLYFLVVCTKTGWRSPTKIGWKSPTKNQETVLFL